MTTRRLALLLTVATLAAAAVALRFGRPVRPQAAAPLAVAGGEGSWAGESVMDTKPPKRITFGDQIDGDRVDHALSGVLPIVVLEERGGRLRIRDGLNGGWVDRGDFVLLRDSPGYFDRRVRAEPRDAWALQIRGVVRHGNGELDDAIGDFDESIRLDPTDSITYRCRGNARAARKDFGRAVKDYDEASRLDPKYGSARFCRAVAQMQARQPGCVEGFRGLLDLQGWKGDWTAHAVIYGHLAAQQAGDDAAAKRFLADAAGKLDAAWPEPAVRFLRGDLDEAGLLKLATDDDKRTEARCILGLHHANAGRPAEALAHYRWVKEHGTTTYVEYGIAVAELDRLAAAAKPAKP